MAVEEERDSRRGDDGETSARREDEDASVLPVEPARVSVREDEFAVLHVTVDGTPREAARAVLAFPISGKADYVSFLDADGEEIALVAHPHELDEASRRAVSKGLERMYYVPRIRRIDSIKETWGVTHWEVLTDCGYASFEVVDREHIRRLSGERFLIQDADGNRFEIEDASQLDPQSRKLIYSET